MSPGKTAGMGDNPNTKYRRSRMFRLFTGKPRVTQEKMFALAAFLGLLLWVLS